MIDEKKLIEQLEKNKRKWTLFASGLHIAIEYTKRQPKVGEWIPVSEKPQSNVWILLQYNDEEKTMCVGFYGKESNEFFSMDDNQPMHREVIAWMPLPEPYKEEVTE